MNQLIDRIAKLPRLQKFGLALIAYVLLAAGFYLAVYTARTAALNDLRTEEGNLTQEKEEVRKKAENREQFEREVAALDEQLATAIKELPNEREIPELLRRISTLGKKNGLEFLLFQPLPEISKNFYVEVPVKISVQGSYHEVAMFMDRVGKLNRIVNVADIKMVEPKETSGRVLLTTDAKAITYRFVEQTETGGETNVVKKNAKEAAGNGEE